MPAEALGRDPLIARFWATTVTVHNPLAIGPWATKAALNVARTGLGLATAAGKLWAIGGDIEGTESDVVESYDIRKRKSISVRRDP